MVRNYHYVYLTREQNEETWVNHGTEMKERAVDLCSGNDYIVGVKKCTNPISIINKSESIYGAGKLKRKTKVTSRKTTPKKKRSKKQKGITNKNIFYFLVSFVHTCIEIEKLSRLMKYFFRIISFTFNELKYLHVWIVFFNNVCLI